MESILSEIWANTYFPVEQRIIRNSQKAPLIDNMREARKALEKELGKNNLPLLDKYEECENMIAGIFEEEAFIKGAHFGIKLMIDVLSDS